MPSVMYCNCNFITSSRQIYVQLLDECKAVCQHDAFFDNVELTCTGKTSAGFSQQTNLALGIAFSVLVTKLLLV